MLTCSYPYRGDIELARPALSSIPMFSKRPLSAEHEADAAVPSLGRPISLMRAASSLGNASSSSEKSPLSGLGFLKSLEKKQTKGTSSQPPAPAPEADPPSRWPDAEAKGPEA